MKLLLLLFTALTINVLAQNGLVKAYYTNGKLESEINYMNNIRDGGAKFYWDNGNIKTELTYNNGKIDGLVKEYYPSGIIKESYTIQDGKIEGPKTLYNEEGAFLSELFYEAGKRIIEKDIPVDDEAVAVTEEIVTVPEQNNTAPVTETKVTAPAETKITKTVESTTEKKSEDLTQVLEKVKEVPQPLDTLTGFVTSADVMPEPHGGWVWLYKKLSYPKEARENKVEGTAKILTFIDEKGKVVDARVAEGFNPLCDEAAKNAVTYTRFKPALINGQAVKIKFVIPVEFKLPSGN